VAHKPLSAVARDDVEEDLGAHNRNWLDRLTFLADGVFAIAATLLSVEIREPPGWRTLPELTKVDPPLTVLTLVTLGLVALVPGLTHLRFPSAAIVLYGALVIAIGTSLAAIYAYAGLIRDYVSPRISRRQRWFQVTLWIFTPTLFLGVIWVTALPLLQQAALLAAMFMVGWPVRVWILQRLA